MKLELKKVTHAKALSEETPAYAAEIWIDGVYLCNVENDGHGGCDLHRPKKFVPGAAARVNEQIAALNKRIAAEFPPHVFDFGNGSQESPRDIESLCHEELDKRDEIARLKRDLSKKILFVKPSDGQVYTVKIPPGQKDQMIAVIKQTHGVARVLNEMTLDEAYAAMQGAAS